MGLFQLGILAPGNAEGGAFLPGNPALSVQERRPNGGEGPVRSLHGDGPVANLLGQMGIASRCGDQPIVLGKAAAWALAWGFFRLARPFQVSIPSR